MDCAFARTVPHLRNAPVGEVSSPFVKAVTVKHDDKDRAAQNKRTGLILMSVALVFFLGIVARKVLEPNILNLLN